ncbi:maleylpyruvate isomerase family mycothiol-dependent enzyme [Streptomyces sp. NPDC004111]|uniref:maleylpyruvate isomerase family mycothiol-dependent enzyme n=1 Tax=Streptomyces sp. NPDC004111 TaxID=3364690 RepID=UPI0036CE3444
MRITAHLDRLAREGESLAAAAGSAGTDATVPTCPGWQVADLLRHTGKVHRWAADHVAHGRREARPDGGEPDLDGAELISWFREGHADLVAALRGAPPDLECWTFLPAPSPLAFWARRQAHETAVHRLDAESAAGALPEVRHPLTGQLGFFTREFALDGIDELLTAFHGRKRSRVRTAAPGTLRIRATDGPDPDAVWTVHLSPDDAPRAVPDGEGPADTELSGPAEVLYATLWNRLPTAAVELTGDPGLAAAWRELSGITWS